MMDTIQHFSHEHPLKLRELFVKEGPPDVLHCGGCTYPICGLTYCCEQCKFLLHKSCAETPREITHPFHLLHPLALSVEEPWSLSHYHRERRPLPPKIFVFRCGQCRFVLDGSEAMATLPDEKKQEGDCPDRLQHLSHEHPLTAFHVKRECHLVCQGCDRTITGEAFVCYDCRFVLHKECAELPRSLQNPHHPDQTLDLIFDPSGSSKCRACGVSYKLFYSSPECRYCLDITCASSILLTPEQQRKEGRSVIKHLSHEHEFSRFTVKAEIKVRCAFCSKFLSSGEFYGCPPCGVFMHDSCAQGPASIVHPFHPEHPISLVKSVGPVQQECFCCLGKNISEYYFSCQSCDFNLHGSCCLESLAYFEGGGSMMIDHPLHDHPLRFGLNPFLYLCEICGAAVERSTYFCNTGKCYFWLHKTCAELLPQMDHPFHPQHGLARNPKKVDEDFTCGACNMKSRQLALSCAKCSFCLDKSCASRKPDFKHPLHEHELAYFKETGGFLCDVCGGHCSFDLYRCVQCSFTIHASCLELPQTVKHRRHWHSLTLYNKYLEDDTGEYYCEICEERRNPDRGVYCCMKCEFFAHIECALGKMNMKISEDLAITMIDEEIVSLEAAAEVKKKEWEEMMSELEELRKRRQAMCS